MDAHALDWVNLALRWAHVITGVAWIGTSFYFNWLNSRIAPPLVSEPGVEGELWSVHGGGFYRVVKYAVAPARLPHTLHWFKWEAYATWLSGFALLVLIYYFGARAFLLDPRVADIGARTAVAIGLGTLAGSWLVYDLLCRSPLRERPVVFAIVLLLLGAALAWALTRVFSARAAYVHVGAALGTIMAANVFRVIIPSQQHMVAALAQGRSADAALGAQAALRSLHNNYLTLPVLFIMVSTHYPGTYGHRLNWLILAGLAVIGAGTRHWFNLRNQGRRNVWILPAAALGMLALTLVTAPRSTPASAGGDGGGGGSVGEGVSFAEVRVIVARRCAACHSSAPTITGLPAAPSGVLLDTPDEIRAQAPRILVRAVETQTMPLGNLTGMTPGEREILGRWIRAGAALR